MFFALVLCRTMMTRQFDRRIGFAQRFQGLKAAQYPHPSMSNNTYIRNLPLESVPAIVVALRYSNA